MSIELSPDQSECFDSMMSWFKNPNPMTLTVGGFAGTGKTTLVAKFRQSIPETVRIAFCAFTGKAGSVLRVKLKDRFECISKTDYCGTIHGLIYKPILDPAGQTILGFELKNRSEMPYDLIVIDEGSMVNETIYADMLTFNLPIIVIGDHHQLPPIEGSLNLMEKPMLRLEKIHRLAENNPIINVSRMAREMGQIPSGIIADGIVARVQNKHPLIDKFFVESGDFNNSVILCGFNYTRVDVNRRARTFLSRDPNLPEIGERVIVLRNNRRALDCPIYNGVLGTLQNINPGRNFYKIRVTIDGEDKDYRGRVSQKSFGTERVDMNEFYMDKSSGYPEKHYLDYFDYGYCLTVHKSQGSEWPRVMLIEQKCKHWAGDNWNRWLYTGVTRSSGELLIVY